MPPKTKKGGKAGKKKKQTKIPIDDIDTTSLNRGKLEEFCVDVSDELIKERRHSDFLRLDRNKLVNMVAIAREQLKILRDKDRVAENKLREGEEEQRIAMELKRQKVIHLKNDLEGEYLNRKKDTMNNIGEMQESHREMMFEIIADIGVLKEQKVKLENDTLDKKLKQEKEHAEHTHITREEDKKMQILSENKREKIRQGAVNQLRIIFSAEFRELESMKGRQKRRFLKDNEKRTTELEHYYIKIMYHNQGVINILNNKREEFKDAMGHISKQYFKLKNENRQLTEELNRLASEKTDINNKLVSSERDKNNLKDIKSKLLENKNLLLNLNIEQDVLRMANEKKDALQKEQEHQEFNTQLNLSRRTQQVLLVLEFYVIHVYHRLDEINVQLSKIKSLYEEKGKWNSVLKSVYDNHNTSLDETNYDIATMGAGRSKLLRMYKERLKKFNIPYDNTGIRLMRFDDILSRIDNPHMTVDEDNILLIYNLMKC